MSQSSLRPSYRPEFIHLANRIAGRKRPLCFEWNGQAAEFSFTNIHTGTRGRWTLGVSLGGHCLKVEVNRLPELAWISPTLAGIDILDLPDELACGLLEACFSEIFAAISKAGVDIAITSVQPHKHRDAPDEIIEWHVNRGSETVWMQGSVAGDVAALACLASLLERVPVVTSRDDTLLPVVVSIVAASMRLKIHELRALELHDVLFADLIDFKTSSACALYASSHQLGIGTLDGRVFSFKKTTTIPAPAMADSALVPLNDIDVELTFVVGQVTLTVGDLRNVAPGFTFELPITTGSDLLVLANGKLFGRGQLIDVGEHLGVRLTELSAS